MRTMQPFPMAPSAVVPCSGRLKPIHDYRRDNAVKSAVNPIFLCTVRRLRRVVVVAVEVERI